MEVDEYLEKIAAERYAREIDQDENIFRNLPFAAAALAIIFAFMAAVRGEIPTQLNDLFAIMTWTLLVLFWGSIATALGFLWAAISARPLSLLSSMSELQGYIDNLRRYYGRLGTLNDIQIEQQVVKDLRTFMIEQYELGAADIQRVNVARLQARNRAFLSLIVALLIALETVVFTFGRQVAYGGANGTIVVQGWKHATS
jgi:cell division protein FtsL